MRHQGLADQPLYLLLEGWTASTVMFTGGEQQMIKVHVSGDMLGLPSLAVTQASDSVVALTDVEVRPFARRGLQATFERHPRLAALIFMVSQEERVELMNRVALMGHATADARLAGFILHLHRRLARADEATSHKLTVPLTQQNLADLIGVTSVHIGRVTQQLQQKSLVRFARKSIEILDYDGLTQLAGLKLPQVANEPPWLPHLKCAG